MKKKKRDKFYSFTMKNFTKYIKKYIYNKEEFIIIFCDNIFSNLEQIVRILELLESNYFQEYYSEYILDEGYTVSLFKDNLKDFNNLKKFVLDKSPKIFRIEHINTPQYHNIFLI